jgi:hypothetical protein
MNELKSACTPYFSQLKVSNYRGTYKIIKNASANTTIKSREFPISFSCSSLERQASIEYGSSGRQKFQLPPKLSNIVPLYNDSTLNSIKSKLLESLGGNANTTTWGQNKTLAQASVNYTDKESLKTLNFTTAIRFKS